MRDSVIYQDILKEGRLEGRTAGRIEMLIECSTPLLGELSEKERSTLNAIHHPHRLNRFAKQITKVSSWAELLAIK